MKSGAWVFATTVTVAVAASPGLVGGIVFLVPLAVTAIWVTRVSLGYAAEAADDVPGGSVLPPRLIRARRRARHRMPSPPRVRLPRQAPPAYSPPGPAERVPGAVQGWIRSSLFDPDNVRKGQ